MLTARRATVADAPGIARVHVVSWQQTYADVLPLEFLTSLDVDRRRHGWERVINEGNGLTAVAVDGDDIVGFAHAEASQQDDTAERHLVALYVLDSYHRLGLGSQLHAAVVDDRGAYLAVWEGNLAAIAFYQALGYRALAKHDVFEIGGHSIPTITMVLDARLDEPPRLA